MSDWQVRFDALDRRFDALEDRIRSVEHGQVILEARMSAMVERQSKLEITSARTLFLMQRLALKVGGIEDEWEPPAG